jgi:hypothetical protein
MPPLPKERRLTARAELDPKVIAKRAEDLAMRMKRGRSQLISAARLGSTHRIPFFKSGIAGSSIWSSSVAGASRFPFWP